MSGADDRPSSSPRRWPFWRRRGPTPPIAAPPPAPPDTLTPPPADAVAAPTPGARPPSPEHERWRRWARAILAADHAWMIVDVETTGLGEAADITEVAAVTPRGVPLFASLIRPPRPIPTAIVALTGITDAMVADAPAFADVYERLLRAHLAARGVLAYNAAFDLRMLQSSIRRHCHIAWQPTRSDDVMRAYAGYRAALHPGGGRQSHSLVAACRHMRIAHDGAHRAMADCLATARLLQAMAR